MAEDLPNLVGEIKNFLVGDLRRTVDVQILTGDGSDENLTGILENATAYSAGAFAGTVLDANRFDVVETAVNQVVVALHVPNAVVVHPTDRSKMRLSKGNDGHYVLPPFIASDGTVVSGVRVVANTGIAPGKFLVGDFSKSSVKYSRGLTVEMTNTDQDDFLRDRFTVKATVRLVHRVRANDYGAFVYGDFDTAIAALEQTS
jgi:HK97 family phage major capsid protein